MNVRTAVAALAAAVLLAAPVRAGDAAPKGDAVPAGYRTITLPMRGTSIAFLKKGDRVDVLVTFDANMKDGKEKVTATILQNIVVRNVLKPGELTGTGAIELLVNPNEAQYVELGEKQGDLQVLIRGEEDKEMKPMEMASFRKLFR